MFQVRKSGDLNHGTIAVYVYERGNKNRQMPERHLGVRCRMRRCIQRVFVLGLAVSFVRSGSLVLRSTILCKSVIRSLIALSCGT